MAFEGQQPLKVNGAIAGADLSAAGNAYKFVKFATTTDLSVIVCAATTDKPCGVLQAPAPTSATGQPVEVVAIGMTKLQTDGTLTVDSDIMTNASGIATPCLATGRLAGKSMGNAAGSGNYITAMVNCVNAGIKA